MMVYKPHLKDKLGYYYDVNSLYPTAMCKAMPVGAPTLVSITPEEFIEGDFFGYVRATVQAPSNEGAANYIGLLPIRHLGRLICPGGTFSGFFFSEELKFALNNGYQLRLISEAYRFQRGENTFKDLIERLNQIKVDAHKNKQEALRNIAKLLMNSMYGRFGMHTDPVLDKIVTPDQAKHIARKYLVNQSITIGGLELISYSIDRSAAGEQMTNEIRKSFNLIPGQTNVPIAAAVTAYSRMLINELKLVAKHEELNLFYSDTDSLVTDGPMPSEYCDSSILGKLKLEHTFKEGIFVAPKIYYLELEDGSIVTKCKGYSGKLCKTQYLDLLEGKTLDLTVTRWSRNLQTGTVQIKKALPYKLNPIFIKRNKILDQGKWIDTAPLVLNQV
jgi:DNA polymerase type B, organellar and viral